MVDISNPKASCGLQLCTTITNKNSFMMYNAVDGQLVASFDCRYNQGIGLVQGPYPVRNQHLTFFDTDLGIVPCPKLNTEYYLGFKNGNNTYLLYYPEPINDIVPGFDKIYGYGYPYFSLSQSSSNIKWKIVNNPTDFANEKYRNRISVQMIDYSSGGPVNAFYSKFFLYQYDKNSDTLQPYYINIDYTGMEAGPNPCPQNPCGTRQFRNQYGACEDCKTCSSNCVYNDLCEETGSKCIDLSGSGNYQCVLPEEEQQEEENPGGYNYEPIEFPIIIGIISGLILLTLIILLFYYSFIESKKIAKENAKPKITKVPAPIQKTSTKSTTLQSIENKVAAPTHKTSTQSITLQPIENKPS